MPKLKPNRQYLSDRVWFMMKTRQDNDITDCTGVIYAKNDDELLWLIEQDVVYDEN